jgi:hypothetical protein
MLRPVRTVRATTKEEVDAALARADQITVEGDDELLSYAVNKAARDPENQIAVELEDTGWRPLEDDGPAPEDDSSTPGAARPIESDNTPTAWPPIPPLVQRSAPPSSPSPNRRFTVAVAAAFATIVIITGLSWLLFSAPTNDASHPAETLKPIPQSAAPVPTPAPDTAPIPPLIGAAPVSPRPPALPPEPSPTPRSDFWANLPSLIWPLVAIVAIVALFLIARQAISTGRNVEISWKVTEKVSGRVVITKVRQRATRGRAAA